MKYLFSALVLTIGLTNIGCPKNDPAPASIVGTPTTQCLSSIPTGPNGQIGGYNTTYPYNNYGGYGSSCAYGYSNNPYYYGYNNWNSGYCPAGTFAVYSTYGVSCTSAYGINNYSSYNFLAYAYINGSWTTGYYANGAWPYNYAAVSCTMSYPGCNCVPVGTYSGYGICAR